MKVVARVLQARLQMVAEEELPDSQCGFRKGHGCSDMIFTVRQLVEESIAKQFVVYVDLKGARWPPHCSTCMVVLLLSNGRRGLMDKRVWVSAFGQRLMGNWYTKSGLRELLTESQFADDVVLLASTMMGVEYTILIYTDVADDFGLTVSIPKTKLTGSGYGIDKEDSSSKRRN